MQVHVKIISDCILVTVQLKSKFRDLTLKRLELIRPPYRTDRVQQVAKSEENQLLLFIFRYQLEFNLDFNIRKVISLLNTNPGTTKQISLLELAEFRGHINELG